MAFPSVVDFVSANFSAETTTHNVTLPTCDAEDLLVLFGAFDGGPTFTAKPTGSGFTELAEITGVQPVSWIGVKVAVGNEGGTTVPLTTSVAEQGGTQVYRIANWHGTIASGVELSSDSSATTANPNPPSLNPSSWDVEDTLWLALLAYPPTTGGNTVTAYPTNYTDGTLTGSTGNATSCFVASARRNNAVASEDPGAFTVNGTISTLSRAWTLAIRPLSGPAHERTILRLSSSSALTDS